MGNFKVVQCRCNHQENPLGLDRDGVVVGNQNNRVSRPVELLEKVQHLPAGVGIQSAGWLVGQNHSRLSH